MGMGARIWLVLPILMLAACAAPVIDEWPPAPVEATDEIVQQYVDRYALKEPSPRVYTDIELKALQILQERVRYQSEFDTRQVSEDRDDESTSSANGRSRAEINAIKRWVYRRYESSHDRRHELRSKYGL